MAALEGHVRLIRCFSHFAARISRRPGHKLSRNIHTTYAKYTAVTGAKKEYRDPLEIFLRNDVQDILHRITRPDPRQIFSEHIVSDDVVPKYKILTDEELKQEEESFQEKAVDRLQMPPFMDMRKPCDTIIAHDPELEGVLTSKYTLTDITQGRLDKDRIVVVRDVDGSLKTADWETRDRMLQIYTPRRGKAAMVPKMFQEKQLEKILPQKKYEYILERACVQFEPDDQHFIRVSRRVYEYIFARKEFDSLRSTRFFGPMSFYYCSQKKIELLLIDMVNRNLVQDASDLVKLYHIIQYNDLPKETNILKILQVFCQTEATATYKTDLLTSLRNFVVNYKVFKRVHQGS